MIAIVENSIWFQINVVERVRERYFPPVFSPYSKQKMASKTIDLVKYIWVTTLRDLASLYMKNDIYWWHNLDFQQW